MSKKYFFVSDIHSHYTPLVEALHENGFDENNQDHILCVLGDVFDRGHETLEVYNYLKSFPKERLILIKGNHEILYQQLLNAVFPVENDFSNGTVRTFCHIAGFDENLVSKRYWLVKAICEGVNSDELDDYANMAKDYWRQVKEIVAKDEITQWIKSNEWLNYLETPHYIFVHSWIPLHQVLRDCTHIDTIGYREDWRNATQQEWEDSMWGCPWAYAKEGWNKTNKTIVCGHWHTSDFFNNLTKEKKTTYDCPLFKSTKYKVIGLDACTIMSHKINVLVLDEEEL